MLFRRDPCGIVCIAMTYAMLLHCLYAMIFVIILPFLSDRFVPSLEHDEERRYLHFSFYGTFNTALICTFVLLSITSHARAAYSDPGFVPLPKKAIDFSDVKRTEANTEHSQVRHKPCLSDVMCICFEQNDDGWTGRDRMGGNHRWRDAFLVCNRCDTYRPARSHHCRWLTSVPSWLVILWSLRCL